MSRIFLITGVGRPEGEGRGGVPICIGPMRQWRPPTWGSCKP